MPTYIFLGPELGKKQDAVNAIRKKNPDAEESVFYAGETPLREIVDTILNISLFSSSRIIIVKNADLIKKKGYIRQMDKRPRTMELTGTIFEDNSALVEIPILGSVAAGVPLLAEENFDGNIVLHRSMLRKNKKYFALKVKGDSMSGAGILEGDTAIIEKQNYARNGEIAVAVIDEAVTLKRFYKENTRIKLQAENPAYKPIYSQDVKILGRLSGIIRSY
jgi:repressor LexA